MGCHPSHLDFHMFQRGRYTTNIHQPVKDLTFIQTTGSFPVAPSVQASRWWQRWGIGNPKKNHRSGLVWLWIDSDLSLLILACHIIPIGSMYGIYGNNYHQYTPNVSIYTIHGSYGISLYGAFLRPIFSSRLRAGWILHWSCTEARAVETMMLRVFRVLPLLPEMSTKDPQEKPIETIRKTRRNH